MIEPERNEAVAKHLYSRVYADPYCDPGGNLIGVEWDQLDDTAKSDWRLLAAQAHDIYLGARPGPPCRHEEYYNTGRCAHMECSNYINKHLF